MMFEEEGPAKKRTRRRTSNSSQKITSNSFISGIKSHCVKQTKHTYGELSKPGIYGNITQEIFAESIPNDGFNIKWTFFQIYYVIIGLLSSLEFLLDYTKMKSKKLSKMCEGLYDIQSHVAKICGDVISKFGNISTTKHSSATHRMSINYDILRGMLVFVKDNALFNLIVECLDYIHYFTTNFKECIQSLVSETEAYTIAAQFMAMKFFHYVSEFKSQTKDRTRKISSLPMSLSSRGNSSSLSRRNSSSLSGRKRRRSSSGSGSPEILLNDKNNITNKDDDDTIKATKCQWCDLIFTSTHELTLHALTHLLKNDDDKNNNSNNSNSGH